MKKDIPYGSQWRIFVDLATVVWLVIFAFSFAPSSPFDPAIANKIGLGLLSVFVADLGITYYRAGERPLAFLRCHWLDVLFVIPYFRIFRVLRVVRFLRLLQILQQPRPAVVMRLSKTMLNGIRAIKKGRRTLQETSGLVERLDPKGTPDKLH